MSKPIRTVGAQWVAASLVALVVGAGAGGVPVGDAIDLGRGDKGELCRAERLWGDASATGMFDRAFNLRCRGWTDTQSAGRLFAVDAKPGVQAKLDQARAARMVCGDAVAVQIAGIGAGTARRCVEREAGFPALAVTAVRGKTIYAAEGLERFSANLGAGLRVLATTGRAPGPSEVPKPALQIGAAKPPTARIDAQASADEAALAGRRSEVIDYTVRGENVEAREIVTRYSARLPANASTGDRVGFLLEAALSESNLGYPDVAAAYLERADALLTSPTSAAAINSRSSDFLRLRLRVYKAMVALNRRDFKAAAAIAAEVLARDDARSSANQSVAGTNPLADAQIVRELNSVSRRSAVGAGLGRGRAAQQNELLRTQALYVRGTALRASGDPSAALAPLADAMASLDRIEQGGGIDTSNLQWIRSQVAVELARVAIVQNRADAARTYLADSVTRLERASAYAGSPLLAQRKLAYAAFLAEHSDRAAASKQYGEALAVLRAGGPSAAAGAGGLDGYFALLEQDSNTTTSAAAARAQFFLAAQMINPPAVAAQIAQIQKIFESGSSEGAVRAKTLQDLDRESRGLATQIAGLPADATKERDRLTGQLNANAAKLLQVRRELAGDQQYLQASDSIVTLPELQAALKPGEVYVKLLTLPKVTYTIAVTHDDALIYRNALATPALADLVRGVRASIDGNVSASGRVVPLVFDVGASFELYNALLGPAERLIANAKTLITEPSGAMTQLPFGVLVGDQKSVDWFAENVKVNSRDYSQVKFLAARYDLDTTVSPRAFLVARTQTASRAKFPYIGFGNHATPTPDELAALPTRGALAERCAVNTDADALRAGFGSLKSIGKKELATASGLAGVGSETIEGTDFTDTALAARKDFGQYAVVHFATHGLKAGELGCDSPPALITSIAPDASPDGAAASSDGLLSFEEIANLHFDANLVVLSACNTAAETTASRARGASRAAGGFRAGRAGQGATLNGLVRAFLVAGSRTVVTTHWAIPDGFKTRDGRQVAASTQLIETFFKNGATSSIASAMRASQAGMIGNADTSHPYYWGAFAIVGDGEKSMFARAS